MLIIPAIDLRGGFVVRLVQGKHSEKIYSRDPVKTAKHWVKQGASLIHVVDLDGAFSGKPKNLTWVKKIASCIDIPIEFGGGVRDIATIKELLRSGVKRVVLGTKAIQDNVFLKKVFREFKDKVIVSLDAKRNRIVVKGWKGCAKRINTIEFAKLLKEIGFTQIIYTDTLKDGTLSGPNVKGAKGLIKASGLKLIISGGISSLEDIAKLKKLKKDGLIGIIVGKALYEGRFTLTEAIEASK